MMKLQEATFPKMVWKKTATTTKQTCLFSFFFSDYIYIHKLHVTCDNVIILKEIANSEFADIA